MLKIGPAARWARAPVAGASRIVVKVGSSLADLGRRAGSTRSGCGRPGRRAGRARRRGWTSSS